MTLLRFIGGIVFSVSILIAGQALAGGKIYERDGKAIGGYDPVAYFTDANPVEGKSRFSTDWNGATWLFSSAENRDLFKASPKQYAPQYGGYCAYAVSLGSTASTVPEAWKIVDGKLYLNNSTYIQIRWRINMSGNIVAADKKWPGIEKGLDN